MNISNIIYCRKCNEIGVSAYTTDSGRTYYCLHCHSRATVLGNGIHVANKRLAVIGDLHGTLTIPEGVTEIYPDSLNNTSIRNVQFPRSLQTIPINCFKNCRNLEELTIPQTITKIEWNAFEGCTALKKVTINGHADVSKDAFKGCSSLKELIINGSVGDIRFSEIPNLKKVSLLCYIKETNGSFFSKLPNFNGCKKLEEVELQNVEEIGSNTFSHCDRLRNVIIGKNTKRITNFAFDDCTSLESITIPEGCVEVAGFNGCTNLRNINLPKSVKKLGNNAFKDCRRFESFVIPEGVEELGHSAFAGCSNLKKIVLPSTLKRIGASAFKGCTNLENIVMPDGVQEIGERAFEQCSRIRALKLPASLKKIGDSAFQSLPIHLVIIPAGITELGTSVFEERWSRYLGQKHQYVVAPNAYVERYLKDNGLKYEVTIRKDGALLEAPITDGVLYYRKPEGGKVKIPLGVKIIEADAVLEQESVKEIVLPDSVREVKPTAFINCTKLQRVVFGKNIKSIGSKAFAGMKNRYIELPASVTDLAPDAFGKGCVVSVAGEMPFYAERLAGFEKTRQAIETKESMVSTLSEKILSLESDLDVYSNAKPSKFADIDLYKDQSRTIENNQAEYERSVAEKLAALNAEIAQTEATINDVSAQLKKTFFLALSKKRELETNIQNKQSSLRTLQNEQEQINKEAVAMYKVFVSELQPKKHKLAELESEQEKWETERDRRVNAIAKAREEHQAVLDDVAKLKSELKQSEKTLARERSSWVARRDELLLAESMQKLKSEKAAILSDMQIPQCDRIASYNIKPRKADVVIEEVLLNEAYLVAIEDWNRQSEVVAHNKFVELCANKIKRVKEINISLKLPEDDAVSQFVTRDMPQLKSNYLFERFEKLNAYFAQKDFWKHFKRSTKDCVSKKKPKLCEKFFVESEYLCLSNGSVHLLFFPYCMVKYEAKKPLILLTYDKARFAVKYDEITETTNVIPPYGELLREQHMYLNADGSVSKRYKNNPIVKTIRFTTVTISEANMRFTCPFKALETALKFETAFNDYKNIFSGGEYSDIYKMILASADLGTIEDAIRNHDEAKKKLIVEEKERAKAQHLSALAVAEEERKKLEKERLAAQAAAEEKRRAIIQRQKELNEERKRQAVEKKKIYSLFEDDADTTPEREEEAVETVAPLEVISKRQISNNVFKTQVKQAVQVLPEDTLCYFVTKDGAIISNKKKLANEGLGGEMTIGFVLTSGIDYTQMSACLMRIESKGVVLGEIEFKLNISFYSDF